MTTPKQIIEDLWNSDVHPNSYGNKEQYYEHLFAQYKMFVDSAEKISDRRNVANTFFLTLNTLLLSTITFIYEKGPKLTSQWLYLFPLIAILVLCYAWWRLIRSYRQLNTAKFKVIGEYERKLPSSPYWQAEWTVLGRGKDPTLYKPLTEVETWVPVIFAGMYILIGITIILWQ